MTKFVWVTTGRLEYLHAFKTKKSAIAWVKSQNYKWISNAWYPSDSKDINMDAEWSLYITKLRILK